MRPTLHRRTFLLTGLGGVLAVAGCGSGGGVPVMPGHAGSGSAEDLAAIPDTEANRALIGINDIAAMWRFGGLGVPAAQPSPSDSWLSDWNRVSQLLLVTGRGGTELWNYALHSPRPLGYDALAITRELVVGVPPNQLSRITVPATGDDVSGALDTLHPRVATSGSIQVVDLGPEIHMDAPDPLNQVTLGLRYLAVPEDGGAVVVGGTGVTEDDVVALASGDLSGSSLADNADIGQALERLGTTYLSALLGTSLIIPPGGTANTTPAVAARIQQEAGLDRLSAAPTMAGCAYLGGTLDRPTARAVAVYPTSEDAASAKGSVAAYAASGTSLLTQAPYSEQWQVTGTEVAGRAVVLDLVTNGTILAEAVQRSDFPLFWKP